jgi:hypothetical protein
MDDAAFREQFKPVHVPSAFEDAENLQDKVIFALAVLNEGTADAVARRLEVLEPDVPEKQGIAGVHQILTELYGKGLIAANETGGSLVFNLHKITQANDGNVDPGLLAPGLD